MDSPTAPSVEEEADEQCIDKELTDYGIELQGLTFDEKRDLLLVFKNSETTALAEENNRVSLQHQNFTNVSSCQSDSNDKSVSEVDNSEVTALECISNEGATCEIPTKHHSIAANVLDESDNSNKLESLREIEVTYSKPKFTPKVSRLSLKSDIVREQDSDIDGDVPKNNLSKMKLSLFPDVENTNENELRFVDDTVCKKNGLPLQKKEDRKRNIDVFNAVQDQNEQTFLFSKQRKIVGKTPYYVVPLGMNLKDFTVYFNEQLNTIAKSLRVTQRSSLNLVPWGNPVLVGTTEHNKSTLEEIDSQDDCDKVTTMPDNQRYNFRGRINKRKCQDDIFSYKVSDEDSSDDDLFLSKTNKQNKSRQTEKGHPFSGITKRKPIVNSGEQHRGENKWDACNENKSTVDELSSNDVNVPKDVGCDDEKLKFNTSSKFRVRNICQSGIFKRTELSEETTNIGEPLVISIDSKNDDEKMSGHKIQTPNNRLEQAYKKKKVSKSVELDCKRSHSQQNESDEDLNERSKGRHSLWLNTSIDKQVETNVIKPMAILPKIRKLNNINLTRTGKKKVTSSVDEEEVDEIIEASDSEESEKSIEVLANSTACPICKRVFPSSDIMMHASDCDGYQDCEISNADDWQSTNTCPRCVEKFTVGPQFDMHVKNCHVMKRLVHPPVSGPSGRNRSKR